MPTFRKIAFARELSLRKAVGSRIRGAQPTFRSSPPEKIAFARELSLRKTVGSRIRGAPLSNHNHQCALGARQVAELYRHSDVSGIDRDDLIRLAVYEFLERKKAGPIYRELYGQQGNETGHAL
jgi:hypothetical protein